MLVECWSVVVIILLVSYIFLRKEKPNLSLSILPLVFVPVLYIISMPMARFLYSGLSLSVPLTRAFMVLLGAISACSIFGFLASKIRKKTFKTFYAVLCNGFTVVFAWILILEIITPIIKK